MVIGDSSEDSGTEERNKNSSKDNIHGNVSETATLHGGCEGTSGYVGKRSSLEEIRQIFGYQGSDSGVAKCGDQSKYRIWDLARTLANQCSSHIDRRNRWLNDIVPKIRSSEIFDIHERVDEWNRNYGTGRAIGIIYHGESDDGENGHLHVYHSCTFRHATCHCGFVKFIGRFKRRVGRRVVFVDDICTPSWWNNFLQYFLTEPREFVYLAVSQRDFKRDVNRCKSLQGCTSFKEQETDGLLEVCGLSRQDCAPYEKRSRESQSDEEVDEAITDIYDPSGERRKGSEAAKGRKIHHKKSIILHRDLVEAIRDFLCVPFYSTCELKGWVEDKQLAFFDKADNDYKRAVNELQRRSQHLSLNEIIQWINESQREPVWYARTENHYMDIKESVDILEKLLLFQYDNVLNVISFLQRLVNILEKKLPKKNTMYIVGTPNSGKTFFCDCVCALMLNVGHVENFVRGQHFPLNDCVARRILMWNEPNLMGSAYDTIKMLTAGDPCPANVKYQGHSVICRTPLLMTGNSFVFTNDDLWLSRMYKEVWKSAKFLKDVRQYPSPKGLIALLQKYKCL